MLSQVRARGEGEVRGPYRLTTKEMTPAERVAWFRLLGQANEVRKPAVRLSFVWRDALREEW